jgi:transcriptional regulator with XRE-family HTH domain
MLRMKAERIRRGWSQLELAFRARIQPSEISRVERGLAVPYPAQAKRLARALRMRADQLTEPVDPQAVAS